MSENREAPHNLEAEQGLLGALLTANAAYDRVSFLAPHMFADPLNGRIFGLCAEMIERGETANPITLRHYFDGDPSLKDVGGAMYLVRLAAATVTVFNVGDYATLIRDLYMRREAIVACGDAVNRLYSDVDLGDALGTISAEEIVGDLQGALDEVSGVSGASRGDLAHIAAGTTAALAHIDHAIQHGEVGGVSTGITDLDRIMPMMASDLLVIGARPGMGKTALGLRIARNVAKQAHLYRDRGDGPAGGVAFFSLEMSTEQLAMRLLAAEVGNISVGAMRRGLDIDAYGRDRLGQAKEDIDRWPLYIDDQPATDVREIARRARKLKRRHGLALIVVDYLQLVTPGNSRRRRNVSRVEDVSEISAGLKRIAKELDVPVLALSQLSRALEQREDKRPILSDLRESGSIEQDADTVAFLYRHWFYASRREPQKSEKDSDSAYYEKLQKHRDEMDAIENDMDVIVGKSRHGNVGSVRLHANYASGSITNRI